MFAAYRFLALSPLPMELRLERQPRHSRPAGPLLASLLATLGMAATVGGALAFEHIGGYIPCALCLMQRTPYYWGIPIGDPRRSLSVRLAICRSG